jgi:ABC-2 type transport system ATP-binding protein
MSVVSSPADPGRAASPDQDSPGPAPAVELVAVERAFGERVALSNVSLTVQPGEILGVVGPSGSGKTTLVRIVVGLIEASSGDVLVHGESPSRFGAAQRGRLGYMPQSFSLYPSLTTLENTRFMASLYGIGWLRRGKRIREVLEFLELWEARGTLAEHLSGGMQRRLSLAGAILHQPPLIVIDEPTAGLDPALRARIWDFLQDLRQQGVTIIMTTQYIEEAERCNTVAILTDGELRAIGTPQELRAAARTPDTIELELGGTDAREALERLRGIAEVREVRWEGGTRYSALVADFVTALPVVEAALASHDGSSVVSTRQASFEEVFLFHTGRR